MHDQAKYEPLEASTVFADGGASRPLPAHTVARGWLQEDAALHTGLDESGDWVSELPVDLDAELLERGRERYEIFCALCHGRTGDGRGMIVQRGFQQPPAYWDGELPSRPIGYFFEVATNGYGAMSGYRAQVPVADRWAIAAWVRVLQRAHATPETALDAQDRERVIEGYRERAEGSSGGGETEAAEDHARHGGGGDDPETATAAGM